MDPASRNRVLMIGGALIVIALLLVCGPLEGRFGGGQPGIDAVETPPDVAAVLRRACYDCHSNEVRWPWYSYVAPASFVVTQDVAAARYTLNFSEWDSYEPDMQWSLVLDVLDFAEEGEMPPAIYMPLHPDAVLTEADLEILREWVDSYE